MDQMHNSAANRRVIPFIARVVTTSRRQQVCKLDVWADHVPVQLKEFVTVRIGQKAPIFGAFGSEGDPCDLVGIWIPFHAPFAIFILDMSTGIRDAPPGPIGW